MGERAPKQDGNDQGEDGHLLVGARPEGGKRLQQPDGEGSGRRHRVADQPADDGADKTLEAQQEAAVVVDRGHRPDQHAGQGADRRGECEGALPGVVGTDPDQQGTAPVDRGGAKRLAMQREAEEPEQGKVEQQAGGDDHEGLGRDRHPQDLRRAVDQRRRAHAFRSEQVEPSADQHEVQRDGGNQQMERTGRRHGLEGDTVEDGTERHHHRACQGDLDGHRRPGVDGEGRRRGQYRRRREEQGRRRRKTAGRAATPGARGVHGEGDGAGRRQDPGKAGRPALVEAGQGQRGEGYELALGHQDDAGDGKHHHQRDREQDIHGPGGQPVLQQEAENRKVHDRPMAVENGTRPSRAACAGRAAYGTRVQPPFSMRIITRLRSSSPRWSVADMV